MKISERREEGVVILDVEGKLTIGNDAQLHDTLRRLLESDERKFLINLKGIKTMDSSGLGELIRCKATAMPFGAVVKLLHVEDKVQQVLEMTRLIGVYDNFNDEVDAIASFR
jgi:anti-sigma B factor antagonist